MLIRLFLLH